MHRQLPLLLVFLLSLNVLRLTLYEICSHLLSFSPCWFCFETLLPFVSLFFQAVEMGYQGWAFTAEVLDPAITPSADSTPDLADIVCVVFSLPLFHSLAGDAVGARVPQRRRPNHSLEQRTSSVGGGQCER